MNFSEWTSYTPEQQRTHLAASCTDVTSHKMPVAGWTTLHPEARLTSQDVDTICAASRAQQATTP